MLKVLLVASYEQPSRSFIKPQYGLISIKKYLEYNNCPAIIEIVDPQLQSPEEGKRKVRLQWDVIGFYMTYPTLLNSIDIMLTSMTEFIEGNINRPLLIGGGPGSQFKGLLDISPLDMLVIGEAERYLLELFNRLHRFSISAPLNQSHLQYLEDLPGNYTFRYTDRHMNSATYSYRASTQNIILSRDEIDTAIYPADWELNIHTPYKEWTEEVLNHSYGFPIYATRGCSGHGCLFCSSYNFFESSAGVRAPSPECLAASITCVANSSLKCTSFILEDDSFIWNKQWMVQVCNEIIKRKRLGLLPSNVSFIIKSRLEQLSDNLLPLMVSAGFTQLNIGIESGSPTVLQELHKSNDVHAYLKRTKEVLKWISKYPIKIHAYMVFFSPNTHIDDLLLTIALCIDFLSAGGEISTYETILYFPGSPVEQSFELTDRAIEYTEITNPLWDSRFQSNYNSFLHPLYGILPTTTKLPKCLLPYDPDTRMIYEISNDAYADKWHRYSKQYKWKAATSARTGLIKIINYLECLKSITLTHAQITSVDILSDRIIKLLPNTVE